MRVRAGVCVRKHSREMEVIVERYALAPKSKTLKKYPAVSVALGSAAVPAQPAEICRTRVSCSRASCPAAAFWAYTGWMVTVLFLIYKSRAQCLAWSMWVHNCARRGALESIAPVQLSSYELVSVFMKAFGSDIGNAGSTEIAYHPQPEMQRVLEFPASNIS